MFQLDTEAAGGLPETLPAEGELVCETDPLGITPGRCYINVELIRAQQLADRIAFAAYFDIEVDDFFGTGKLPKREWTMTVIKHRWKSLPDARAHEGTTG